MQLLVQVVQVVAEHREVALAMGVMGRQLEMAAAVEADLTRQLMVALEAMEPSLAVAAAVAAAEQQVTLALEATELPESSVSGVGHESLCYT
jgi:hypothetical protein